MTPAPDAGLAAPPRLSRLRLLAFAVPVFLVLCALGTWQVQRLAWKEDLLATMAARVHAAPIALGEVEARIAAGQDIEYQPMQAAGRFLHAGERHYFATHDGESGFFLYTPLQLADGRILFVNRGFVPFDRRDSATRPQSLVEGEVTVTGLAREPLTEKPSFIVPDNDPAKNTFYWKDIGTMAATAGLPAGATVLPLFLDADATPNPGDLPVGGVTLLELPNNHLQYAVTWYGLAAVLAVITALMLRRRP